MVSKVREEPQEWRPAWGEEDRAEIERLKAELRRLSPIVRRLRQELGMSQADAAKVLDTTQSNVSKIEAKHDPALSVLRRLVESCGGRLVVRGVMSDGREISLLGGAED
jgi:ribosome-binding protein aMBF1 (putative translation factor)